jgi:archaemetzincin
MIKKINIITFNSIEKEIIEKAVQAMKKQFNVDAEFFKEIPIPWTAERNNQIKASDLLLSEREILENNNADAILALTEKDLFMPDLNFLFGLADPIENIAIISIYRLKNLNKNKYLSRVQKETIHEVGHLFNLEHCENSNCVMNFSDNIEDVDKKENKLCAKCERKI